MVQSINASLKLNYYVSLQSIAPQNIIQISDKYIISIDTVERREEKFTGDRKDFVLSRGYFGNQLITYHPSR